MLVTPRLTVAEVLRTDPTMALALGITESQAKNQSPKVAPASAPDRDLDRNLDRDPGRGVRRQADDLLIRAPDADAGLRQAPAPEVPLRAEPTRMRPRDDSRDLSDADRYRQSQAARAVSVYEAVQTADRRLPAGSSSIDGRV